MDVTHLVEREMTHVQFARMNAGFDDHTQEHGNRIIFEQEHWYATGHSRGALHKRLAEMIIASRKDA